MSTGTKHTCNEGDGPRWGRKTPGCARCDELLAGAEPRSLPWATKRVEDQRQADAAMRDHFAPGGPHARGVCGPVCTFADW